MTWIQNLNTCHIATSPWDWDWNVNKDVGVRDPFPNVLQEMKIGLS